MKPAVGKEILNDCLKRGWVRIGDVLYTPAESAKLQIKKKAKRSVNHITGWIDDTRNIANKAKQIDIFIKLIQQELNLEVWPEFYVSTEKNYRVDYVIPTSATGQVIKIAIEVNGGIWSKGNSGHSSGTGIKRDMEKSNLLASLGWRVISIEPSELNSLKVLNLIRSMLPN